MIKNQTINQAQDQIIEDFSFFDEWMDRYEHIIELGKNLPAMPEEHKIEENLVKGCQAQVWLHAETSTDPETKKTIINFQGDSDAIITKGLVALVLSIFSGHTEEEIANADLYCIDKIGLNEHLSPTRANGLSAMIQKIKTLKP